MNNIQIKEKLLTIPLIQGGMGIGVSRCCLAGAVAREGGMGVISAAQIGYDDPDFRKNPIAANLKTLPVQIQRARELSGGKGLIGVNLMTVTQSYKDYVKVICEAGADAIISGAGLPTDLPGLARDYPVALAPIVSSAKSASVILKYWDRKWKRTADFLIIEGPMAGGHLGFSREELSHFEMIPYDEDVRAILEVKRQYEEKYQMHIPVFLAGGIFCHEDVTHALSLGVDGVQVASRFVATKECDASDSFKQAYVQARPEDIIITDSPVGMPGRAINNAFLKSIRGTSEKITHCFQCLKACNPSKTRYCITKALINAVEGNLDEGLIFCGSRIGEIKSISTVHQVIAELLGLSVGQGVGSPVP